jgi:hypothetical protein
MKLSNSIRNVPRHGLLQYAVQETTFPSGDPCECCNMTGADCSSSTDELSSKKH